MKKLLVGLTAVLAAVMMVSCSVGSVNNGSKSINAGQDTVVVQLQIEGPAKSKDFGDDTTTIDITNYNATIQQTVVQFLDSADQLIVSQAVLSENFGKIINVTMKNSQMAQIAKVRVNNYWQYSTQSTIVTKDVAMQITEGYTMITINVGNFYGVGVQVNKLNAGLNQKIDVFCGDSQIVNNTLVDGKTFNIAVPFQTNLIVKNVGDLDLVIYSIKANNANYKLNGAPVNLTLHPGDVYTQTVICQPAGPGIQNAVVTISNSDYRVNNFNVNFTANAIQTIVVSATYTANATYNVPANLVGGQITIKAIGGGGGGGGNFGIPVTQSPQAGAGGQAAQSFTTVPLAITGGTVININIGAGGIPGINGNYMMSPAPTAGGNGGTTTVSFGGSTFNASGGIGGLSGQSGSQNTSPVQSPAPFAPNGSGGYGAAGYPSSSGNASPGLPGMVIVTITGVLTN
jgi:hypothetical protein